MIDRALTARGDGYIGGAGHALGLIGAKSGGYVAAMGVQQAHQRFGIFDRER
jgi:hypothetical protein